MPMPMTDNVTKKDAMPDIMPAHHVHGTEDPIPGNRGVPTVDYSAETMERTPSAVWADDSDKMRHHEEPFLRSHHETQHTSSDHALSHVHSSTHQHPSADGAAVDNREEHHPGHASGRSDSDKMVHHGTQHTPSDHAASHVHSSTHQQPPSDGAAVDTREEHHPDHAGGKVKTTDKLMGKAQQAFGKATHNTETIQKGEQRESGGI